MCVCQHRGGLCAVAAGDIKIGAKKVLHCFLIGVLLVAVAALLLFSHCDANGLFDHIYILDHITQMYSTRVLSVSYKPPDRAVWK